MIFMKTFTLSALLILFFADSFAQENNKPVFSWNTYAELYYQFDFNQPSGHQRPSFLYSHNRWNEFNLNLGYIKGGVHGEQYRAAVALAAGTYINANYSNEPDVLKFVYEASAGLKLAKKKNLWFDIGIMPSHIGFESAVSKDCWTLSRSILAENSPYFETGAKLTYSSGNDRWVFSGLILNGWQRITRPDGFNQPAFGTQVSFKPSSSILINYSTFFGSDHPDSTGQYRIFQNLYSVIAINDQWGVTAGFDYGLERNAKPERNWKQWYSPVIIVRYAPGPHWAGAVRAEYYDDSKGVIIPVSAAGKFAVAGLSANLDYLPLEWMALRLEARTLQSKDPIFTQEDNMVKNSTSILFSTAISF